MPVFEARFERCRSCDRLITVDSLNPAGRCIPDCGGAVGWVERPPAPAWFDAMAAAHSCPSVESGNPEDCAFGNKGCYGPTPEGT